jgi:hypothetical protein
LVLAELVVAELTLLGFKELARYLVPLPLKVVVVVVPDFLLSIHLAALVVVEPCTFHHLELELLEKDLMAVLVLVLTLFGEVAEVEVLER